MINRVRGFFEYKIQPERREDYLQLLPTLQAKQAGVAGFTAYSVSESLDQKNLFVETFFIPSLEEYHQRTAKLMKDPEWVSCMKMLDDLIEGGTAKKKVWFFQELLEPLKGGGQ